MEQTYNMALIEFGVSHFDDFLAEGNDEELVEFIRAAYHAIRLTKEEKKKRETK